MANAPSPRPPVFAPTLQRSSADIAKRFGSLSSRQDVADLLEISDKYLKSILYFRKEPLRYRTFVIRKRSGGDRHISSPPVALRILQGKLNHVFQLVCPAKSTNHGFVKGRSFLTNAGQHVGRRWVLNVDIEDFFPSINFGRVRGALMAKPCKVGPAAATVIAQIACAENALPQGAPSSPMLANMVAARLDGELLALAMRYGCIYTRYADDLTFSTRNRDFPQELAAPVGGFVGESVAVGTALRNAVESNGFRFNVQKTRLQFRDCHQEVTGVTVNHFPNVSRSYIRTIRAMLHWWASQGLGYAESRYNSEFNRRSRGGTPISVSFRHVLRGRIEHIRAVKGLHDPVYCKLRDQLHDLDNSLIPSAPIPQVRVLPRPGSSTISWGRHYQSLKNRVFLLEMRESSGQIRSGTAFAFRDGVAATAEHMLHGDVSLHNSAGSFPLKVAFPHPERERGIDCALLPFAHGQSPFVIAPAVPMPGDDVAIVGFARIPQRQNALGIYAGSVEAVPTDYARSITFIQVSVPSAGGLSGSPVIDRRGRLVGIVVKSAFEDTADEVPGREFCTVLPVGYLQAVDMMGPALPVPLPG